MSLNPKDTSYWVSELLSGHDPSDLPKDQQDAVYNALLEEKEAAISKGAVTQVKTIQNVLNAISEMQNENAEEGADEDEQNDNDKEEEKRKRKELIEKTLDSLTKSKKLKPSQAYLIPNLITKAKERKQECIKKEDFRQAQVYEDIIQYLLQHKGKCGNDEKRVDKYEHTRQLYKNAVAALQTEEELRDTELQQFEEEYKQNLEKFESEYKANCQKFEESIPSELPACFVKRSNQYLNMRKVEKSLLVSKRYTEAADIKERADELDKVEALENKAKFDEKNQQERNKMAQEHEKQRECLEENAARKKQKIITDHEDKIAILKLAVENIERKLLEMEERFNKQPLSVPKTKEQRGAPKQADARSSPFITQGKDYVSVMTQTLKRYKFPQK